MLAGLAAQTLTVGAVETATAMATAALVFVVLLVMASILVSAVDATSFQPMRMVGPTLKRWSGFVLVAVGVWFVTLATLSDPILGS